MKKRELEKERVSAIPENYHVLCILKFNLLYLLLIFDIQQRAAHLFSKNDVDPAG